ncbi:MAG: copper oxidase [Myxococcota bacterium]
MLTHDGMHPGIRAALAMMVAAAIHVTSTNAHATTCEHTVTADVVALDQAFFWNRLGAAQPQGMIYALRRDVVPVGNDVLTPGNVMLRPDKRPRPLVLRVNAGDCLRINFQNLLNPVPVDGQQPATRHASIHVAGMSLVNDISDDGSFVGANPSSLVAPGDTAVYTLYAATEGTHVMISAAAMAGGEGNGGSMNAGLFGAINVEPRGARWYRSQVTHHDLQLATRRDSEGRLRRTSDGHPLIDFEAVYPPGHPREGLPILNMLKEGEVVHGDLTAIITGPTTGRFPSGTFPENPTLPDREQPFREFTIIYHDEIGAVQAFPEFSDPVLEHTLHSVRDGFAINYGSAGAGAEILSNRFGVGPSHACTECKYEEFFLTSWTVSDPAQVVDVFANADLDSTPGPDPGAKATKVLYADDPSNVYHGYLNDHTRFRILHGGSKEHHIHHQHTHQWLHTANSDNSAYLDSQAIGPGASFTLEMSYRGAGNRNQAVGDSIFHCHFYPHFAQGMWALWRVHDVFESGTRLDANGRPAPGSRALPDGEIVAGTPIPAVVPMPTRPMAPMPEARVTVVGMDLDGDGTHDSGQVHVSGRGNPGYPFFVPGIAGHRPPSPPLDIIDDGGLPRHIVRGGTFVEQHTRLDMDKVLVTLDAVELPEEGTDVEKEAMEFHEQRRHSSFTPAGGRADFITNGARRRRGAPFADPCIDDDGDPVGVRSGGGARRVYKGADIQLDMTINKAGWHFPQARIGALWGDVDDLLDGDKAPEPLFFRAESGECIEYQFTNLVPNIYALDDFQVRTPTDVIGQHIHLVKFDVLASDGSANGFNYQDGSFSPDEVRERINAINAVGGLLEEDGDRETLRPRRHPYFGAGPDGKWLGAQTTVQRWMADEVLNNDGEDRTLRTVYTHDHFGPSTHQQVGLYMGLVIEPRGSRWRDPETGNLLGDRFDGGPTSFRADIITSDRSKSYREFLLEFTDFQLAYEAGGGVDDDGNPVPDPARAINPPGREEVGLPFLVARPELCPGNVPPPCPEAISADDPGTMTVNYRNEPIALRIFDPETGQQAEGEAGDLSSVFRSTTKRADDRLNEQPDVYPDLTEGVRDRDPFTPLLRAYENDRVQVRVLVGGQEESHNLSVHGLRWFFEPSDPNSGYRNSQSMGISEHFELITPALPLHTSGVRFVDYLYKPSSSVDGLWNGVWGLLRTYNGRRGLRSDLLPLPSNPEGHGPDVTNEDDFSGVCPRSAPRRGYRVVAALAQDILPGGTLIYNPRVDNGGPLHDPTAILYVREEDLDPITGQLLPTAPVEPLILRANAGDCISVRLENRLPAGAMPDFDGFNTLPMLVDNFNANQVRPSSRAGLHAQLVEYDVTTSDGVDVGFNPRQTVREGRVETFRWFAGILSVDSRRHRVATPVEFGAINLLSSDPIKHSNKGAVGALIVEPKGSTWYEDAGTRASATIVKRDGTYFREFVMVLQTDVNLRFSDDSAIPNLAREEDAEDSAQKGVNYRSEPLWQRLGFAPDAPAEVTRNVDFSAALSNAQVEGEPVTPIFTARPGESVRFRLLEPGGHARNLVFAVQGHQWQEEPYAGKSTRIAHNPLSEIRSAQEGLGPSNHFDVVLEHGAGGPFRVEGDYLWRDRAAFAFAGGIWGIFRVE